jgi:predicted site-specific integrase-resolvase
MPAYTLSIVQASRRFKVSKPTILTAIRKGKIPVQVITVSQFRVTPKDMVELVSTLSETRRRNGSRGGLQRHANWKARRGA